MSSGRDERGHRRFFMPSSATPTAPASLIGHSAAGLGARDRGPGRKLPSTQVSTVRYRPSPTPIIDALLPGPGFLGRLRKGRHAATFSRGSGVTRGALIGRENAKGRLGARLRSSTLLAGLRVIAEVGGQKQLQLCCLPAKRFCSCGRFGNCRS